MFRVTSLTSMSDRQLNRWIKRIAAILVIGTIAFVGFYVFDRWRPPSAPIVDREVASLEAAVQADPSDIASRGRLADLYVTKGRYQEAVTQYQAILATGQSLELAHYGLGTAYQGLGDLDGAAKEFQAVVDIAKDGEMANVDPMLNSAYYALGEIALAQDRPADAVTALEAAVSIKRSDADALYLLGTAYVAVGKPDEAIGVIKQAIAFVPLGWSEPYVALGTAYAAKGDAAHETWAAAMAALSDGDGDTAMAKLQTITDGPAALDAAIGLGLAYERAGDGPTAAEWYRKALVIDPEDGAAKLGLTRVSPPASSTPAAPATTPLPALPAPGDLSGGNG
jgi:tetratricopeptide (TPR) repeat protein